MQYYRYSSTIVLIESAHLVDLLSTYRTAAMPKIGNTHIYFGSHPDRTVTPEMTEQLAKAGLDDGKAVKTVMPLIHVGGKSRHGVWAKLMQQAPGASAAQKAGLRDLPAELFLGRKAQHNADDEPGVFHYLGVADRHSLALTGRKFHQLSRAFEPTQSIKITSRAELPQAIALIKASWNRGSRAGQAVGDARIREITLEGDTFCNDDLKDLAGLHLETVRLPACRNITDDGLAHLASMKEVDLSGCHLISDQGLAHLTTVQTIKLAWCNRITDAGLHHLTQASSVDLTGCVNVSNAGLAHITNAKYVNLSMCPHISDTGMVHIANADQVVLGSRDALTGAVLACHPAVRGPEAMRLVQQGVYAPDELGYAAPAISDQGLVYLRNVRALDLSGNMAISDAGLRSLSRAKEVILNNCGQIGDPGLAHLVNASKIGLRRNRKITDVGLAHLAKIEAIDLSDCTGFTDQGLASLSKVNDISLVFCDQVSDQGLGHLRAAKRIDLCGCTQVSDAGLVSLSGAEWISLAGCRKITGTGVAKLVSARHINLTYSGVSGVSQSALKARLPTLESVSYRHPRWAT